MKALRKRPWTNGNNPMPDHLAQAVERVKKLKVGDPVKTKFGTSGRVHKLITPTGSLTIMDANGIVSKPFSASMLAED